MLVHMCKYVCFVCVYSSQQWEPLLTDPLTLRPVSTPPTVCSAVKWEQACQSDKLWKASSAATRAHTHSQSHLFSVFSPLFICIFAVQNIFLSFHFLKRWQAINTNSDWNTQGLISILGTYDWEHTSTHMLQVTLPPHFSVTEASVSSALHLAFKKHWY